MPYQPSRAKGEPGMGLAVISRAPHHQAGGRLVGWGPTVRVIDELDGLFEEVVHIAPVRDGPAPASGLPYRVGNVRVVAVPPSGGESFENKLGSLRVLPRSVPAIRKELAHCDIGHVRCPSGGAPLGRPVAEGGQAR